MYNFKIKKALKTKKGFTGLQPIFLAKSDLNRSRAQSQFVPFI